MTRGMEQRLCIACSKEVPPENVSCECGHVFEGSRLSTLGKRYTDQRACSEATFLHNPDEYFFAQKLRQKKKKPLSLLAVDSNNNNNNSNNNNDNSNNNNNNSGSSNSNDENNKEKDADGSISRVSKYEHGVRRPSAYRRSRRRNQRRRKVGWNMSAQREISPEEASDRALSWSDQGNPVEQCLYGDDVLRAALDEINRKLQVHTRFWSQKLL